MVGNFPKQTPEFVWQTVGFVGSVSVIPKTAVAFNSSSQWKFPRKVLLNSTWNANGADHLRQLVVRTNFWDKVACLFTVVWDWPTAPVSSCCVRDQNRRHKKCAPCTVAETHKCCVFYPVSGIRATFSAMLTRGTCNLDIPQCGAN